MLKNSKYVYGDRFMKIPGHLNCGQHAIDAIWSHGDRVALINGANQETITFREIAREAMNIAISLTHLKVKSGDVVAILTENRQEYWGTLIGILCSRATGTAINPLHTKDELKHAMFISKPKIVFCSPIAYTKHGETLKLFPFLEHIILFGKERQPNTMLYDDLAKRKPKECVNIDNFLACETSGPHAVALILNSSGTTGLPKGAMLSHLSILSGCNIRKTINTDELCLTTSPWFHLFGLMATLRSLCFGGPLLYLPKYEIDLFLRTIEKYRVYQTVVSPPILLALSKLKINYDVSSVQLVYSSAASLRDDMIKAVKERFPNLKHIIQGYGLTETGMSVLKDTFTEAHLSKIGGVGVIACGCMIKIVDVETRKPLGPNKAGEICVKGPTIMNGYIGSDARDAFDDEGFFKTGDIGYYDEDKYFFVIDRIKELIKYKGYQVPPAEIEGVLLQHPGIRDAGVVGVPHDEGGEVPRAYVTLQHGCEMTKQEVMNIVAEKLSNPKHLRGGVEFVNEIPKNASGKIIRKKLREMAQTKCKSKL